ncbi:MAG: pyridoxamine 5'-phosphate oxidase, partial [Rickettsiales bacterium]|nr:pyridoxamine 5'-phosphate oxidase [Rickettsiales bacterium]
MAISDMRRQYAKGSLQDTDLTADPFSLFDRWLNDAITAEIPDPTA